jgi:hypothetical protein
LAETLATARTICGNAPLPVLATENAFDQMRKLPQARNLESVAEYMRRGMDSADHREGRAALLETKKPISRVRERGKEPGSRRFQKQCELAPQS